MTGLEPRTSGVWRDKYTIWTILSEKSVNGVLETRTRAPGCKAQTNPLSYGFGGTPQLLFNGWHIDITSSQCQRNRWNKDATTPHILWVLLTQRVPKTLPKRALYLGTWFRKLRMFLFKAIAAKLPRANCQQNRLLPHLMLTKFELERA